MPYEHVLLVIVTEVVGLTVLGIDVLLLIEVITATIELSGVTELNPDAERIGAAIVTEAVLTEPVVEPPGEDVTTGTGVGVGLTVLGMAEFEFPPPPPQPAIRRVRAIAHD